MSLTIINWCPDEPCNPCCSWWSGDANEDINYQSGSTIAAFSYSVDITLEKKPLCMPRWGIWGYIDGTFGTGVEPYWTGPYITLPVPNYSPAGKADIVYSLNGTEITIVHGEMIFLGTALSRLGINALLNTIPNRWNGSGVALPQYGPSSSSDPIAWWCYYTEWNLPLDPIEPLDTSGLFNPAPRYGFLYDGPINPSARNDPQTIHLEGDAYGDLFVRTVTSFYPDTFFYASYQFVAPSVSHSSLEGTTQSISGKRRIQSANEYLSKL